MSATEPDPKALADWMAEQPGILLELDPQTAFMLAASLQLACRHPQMDDAIRAHMSELVDHISNSLGGPVVVVIQAGWSQ
jgi:hypothetical protein